MGSLINCSLCKVLFEKFSLIWIRHCSSLRITMFISWPFLITSRTTCTCCGEGPVTWFRGRIGRKKVVTRYIFIAFAPWKNKKSVDWLLFHPLCNYFCSDSRPDMQMNFGTTQYGGMIECEVEFSNFSINTKIQNKNLKNTVFMFKTQSARIKIKGWRRNRPNINC